MSLRSAVPQADAAAAASAAARSGAGAGSKRPASSDAGEAAERDGAGADEAPAVPHAAPSAACPAAADVPVGQKRARRADGGAGPASGLAGAAAPFSDADAAAAADSAAAPSVAAAPEPMSDAEAGSDEARSGATAASASAAAAAAPASTAGTAAATRRSPAARMDRDSLSLVLSMLNSTDFLSALRVGRQWRAAASTNTAWPPLRVESLVQKLRDDDYGNAEQRRLRVREVSRKSRSPLVRLAASAIWSKANDVRCELPSSGMREEERRTATTNALQALGSFDHLTALNLIGSTYDQAAVEALGALASRLQVFELFDERSKGRARASGRSIHDEIFRLSGLRVLVCDTNIPPAVLLQLRLLEFYHLEYPSLTQPTAAVVRELSLRGRLRTLSFEHPKPSSSASAFDSVLQLAAPAVAVAHPHVALRHETDKATLASLALLHEESCSLTELALVGVIIGHSWQVEALSSISSLTRLQIPLSMLHTPPVTASGTALAQRLTEARVSLTWWSFPHTDHAAAFMEQFASLRLLQLQLDSEVTGKYGRGLMALLRRCVKPTLEDLALHLKQFPAGGAFWSLFSPCARLRRLFLNVPGANVASLAPVLAELPQLESCELVVHAHEWNVFDLSTAVLLPAVARSHSWISLILHVAAVQGCAGVVCAFYGTCAQLADFSTSDAAAVAALRSSKRARDFRVTCHAIDVRGRAHSEMFAPTITAAGAAGWERQ